MNSSVAQPPGLTPSVSNAQLAAQYIMPPFLYPPQLATTAQQFATGPASFILPQVTQTNAQGTVGAGPMNVKPQHAALLQQYYGAPGGGGFDEMNLSGGGGGVNDLSKLYGGGGSSGGNSASGNTNPLTGQSLQQQQQKNSASGSGGISANDFIKNFGGAGGNAGQVMNKVGGKNFFKLKTINHYWPKRIKYDKDNYKLLY